MSSAWRTRGACNGLPYELMVMDDDAVDQIAAAKAVCHGCEVAGICLNTELDRMRHDFVPTIGVLGGTSAVERVELAGGPPAPEFEHGEPRHYRRCVRRPEGACDPCKTAWAHYSWDLRERRGHIDKERARAKKACIEMMHQRRQATYDESMVLRSEVWAETVGGSVGQGRNPVPPTQAGAYLEPHRAAHPTQQGAA